MGKAITPRDSIDSLIKTRRDIKKQYGITRQNFSGIFGSAVASIARGGGKSSEFDTNSFLSKSQGGTIQTHLAFFPKNITISGGVISLGDSEAGNFGGNSTRVVVIGDGGADDLDTITGGVEGQILFLQAAPSQITLKHGTGNIETPDFADKILADNEIALLIYDTVGDPSPFWRVVATYEGGGAGADNLGDHTATTDLKMEGNRVYFNTGLTKFVGSLGTAFQYVNDESGGSFDFYIDDLVNEVMKIDETDTTINTNLIPLNTGKTVGAVGSVWDEGFIDRVTFTSNVGLVNANSSISNTTGNNLTINAGTSRKVLFSTAGTTRGYFDTTGLVMDSGGQDIHLLGGDIISDTGDLTLTSGDLSMDNGELDIYKTSTQDSTIFMKYGPAASVDQRILSDSGGIEIWAGSGNTILFRISGTGTAQFKDSALEMLDGQWIRPASASQIGITANSDGSPPTSIGSEGTIMIPEFVTGLEVTKARLDGWFGTEDGAVGYVTDNFSGFKYRLYIRDAFSNAWNYWDRDGIIS